MPGPRRTFRSPLGLVALALLVSACASTSTSTSGFSGEEHGAAQAIANLRADVSSANEAKVCRRDLSGALVAKLNALPGGCQGVIKHQAAEVDNFDLTIQSIRVGGSPARRTATARVKSVYEGKKTISTLSLVKEGRAWKLSGT
jgi:hypothetical protein